ncbi:complement factor H isoform X4 [Dendropsophus ebraccatus]|uniref:complement factor H isoform X2 n=1 Tax=Dendropsophus ebraccatus TaxID=150705 RepID=UPI0038314ABE
MSLLGYVLLLTVALCCTAVPAPDKNRCPKPERREIEELQGEWEEELYPENTSAQYLCRPGYSRLGTIKIICLKGKWENVGTRGQCRKKSCGHPGDIPFGSFSLKDGESFVFGAVVEYSCEDGYQMVSRERTRECTVNGWNNYPPHCEVRNCPPVEAAGNVNVLSTSYDDEYSVGQVVRFECKNPNHKLEGATEIFCTSDGSWNKEPPHCVDISCPRPSLDNNGNVSPVKSIYTHNEVIQITCDQRFRPSTNREIRCTKDGWIPTPSCDEITCSVYTDVGNGKLVVEQSVYRYGDTIEVECDDGYVVQMDPDKPRTCTSNGWYPPARCVSKKCDKPDIKNGNTYNHNFPIEPGRSIDYLCHTNYVGHYMPYWGRTTWGRIKCTNLGWDPEPKCTRQCSYRQAYVENAEPISPKSVYLEGEKIAFKCKYNYEISDGENGGEITCLPNGEFTPAKCSKTCKVPELPNGKITSRQDQFEISQYLQYECNKGYMTEKRKLSSTAQCLSDGWSEKISCIPITCIHNDRVYNDGEIIENRCPPGQEPQQGSELGQCYYFGIHPLLVCQDIMRGCPIPHSSNFILSPHRSFYPVGSTVSLSCGEGSTRVGDRDRLCTDEGWNPPLPKCEEIKCNIPEQHNLIRKPSKLNYKEKEEVLVSCERGFIQTGSNKTKCTETGWTPPLPVCEEKPGTGSSVDNEEKPGTGSSVDNEDEKPVQSKTTASPADKKPIQSKTTASPAENKPIQLKTTASPAEGNPTESTATASPAVDDTKEKRKKCPLPYIPKNAEIKDLREVKEYYSGDNVTMMCSGGYKIQGSQVVRCIEGSWELPPVCIQLIPCRNAPSIDNGDITESTKKDAYMTDNVVTFICNPGFHLNGLNQSTCSNGRWTALPTCKENPCTEPPKVKYATALETTKTFNHGEQAKYECEKGFRFSGDISTASCVRGRWMNPPECVTTSCSRPPSVPNSTFQSKRIKANYASGEKVTYVCNAGFSTERSLTGEAECENTNWINLPVCRQIGARCGPPPVVQYGDTLTFSKDSYKSGDSVQYKCPEYYKMNGSSIVRCQNGVWDEAPVCLEPCTARERDMEENNIQLKWIPNRKLYSEHDDSMEFQCKYGYEAPSGTAMRSYCLRGKLSYPKCFKRGFCVLDESAMLTNNINYSVSSIVENGQTITFQCIGELKTEDNLEAKCELKKINYPKCVASKSCETPKIQNGNLKGERKDSYDSGSNVEFKCKKDYVINGPINAKCENGEWTELPVCFKPCRISPEELSTRNIQLLPSDDPKSILDSAHLHGTELGVTCLTGFRRLNQASFMIECYDGDFRYRKCFSGKTCRIDQDDLDTNDLILDEMLNSDVLYEENDDVYFKCKTGSKKAKGKCSEGKLSYPNCKEVCRINQKELDTYSLVLDEKRNSDLLYLENEEVYFKCKTGSRKPKGKCSKGKLSYPSCRAQG